RAFQHGSSPVLEPLELLKEDPELYGRRSVAKKVNDIGIDHADLLTAVAKRWLRGAAPERRWIVGHALRSAIKRADAGALGALGYGGQAKVSLRDVRIAPREAQIGVTVTVAFTLANPGRKPQRVMADLVVHFV